MNPFATLLESERGSEAFTRRALALLEADLREAVLLGLAEWERLEIVSAELFSAVASLQRPSYGTWNGLRHALRAAQRQVLRGAPPAVREKLEGSPYLRDLLAFFEEKAPSDLALALGPLAEITRTETRRLRMGDALGMPITLRNRVSHDAPTDARFWDGAAAALRPLVAALAGGTARTFRPCDRPAPWFLVEGDAVLAFNGVESDFSIIYVSPDGGTRHEPGQSGALLLALQRLLGKAEVQDKDFRALLSRLAPEEIRGVVLGDYLVGRPVGSGGFGTVHVARQLSTGRKLAVKILRDGFPPEDRARFQQEAAYLSLLDHPGIVKVVGFGEEAWRAPRTIRLAGDPWYDELARGASVKTFMALEWVDGRTLDDVHREGAPRDERELAGWFAQAARALAAVHAAGLIHRDVKPSNLMVTGEGTVRLMDFGIARSQQEERTLRTATGAQVGTPAYMSPEQLRAADADAEVGPATDIYSLCATFYELGTGRRLFDHDRESAETVRTRKLEGERPPHPRSVAAAGRRLSWEMETILLGGLEPEVSDRHASMDALAADLERLLRDEPIEHRRPSVRRRLRLGYRRHRTATNLVASFLVAAVAGVSFYVQSIRAEQARTLEQKGEAERHARRAEEQKEVAEERQARAEREAFRANAGLVEVALERLWDLRRRLETKDARHVVLEAASVAAKATAARKARPAVATAEVQRIDERLAEMRGSASLVARQAAGAIAAGTGRVLGGAATSSFAPAWSPDGRTIAAGSGHLLVLWDRESGRPTQVFEGPADVMACVFSPDGREVLTVAADRTLQLWDRATGGLTRVLEGHPVWVVACAFAPDGREVLSASQDRTLRLWDRATGALVRSFEGHTGTVDGCAFSGDGREVLSASADGTLRLWDRATGALVRSLEGHTSGVHACAFSPDGREILSASLDRTLKLWDRETGKPIRTIEGHPDMAWACAFSPDGREVLSASMDRTLRLWDRATGALVRSFEGHTEGVTACAFAPDGREVLSASMDRTLRLWDRESGALVRSLEGQPGEVRACAFSPDGREVLSGSADRTLELRDRVTGALARSFEGHTEAVTACAFSPDGRVVLSGSADRTVRLWDRTTGALVRSFEGHAEAVTACAFSPDGRAVLSGSEDRTLRLWDRTTGALVRSFEGHTEAVTACAFSPDGGEVASASRDGTLKLWDRAAGTLVRSFAAMNPDGAPFLACAFSPDGRAILSAEGETLRLFDRTSGTLLRSFEGHTRTILACAFSPDGREVLSASDDRTLRLWNRETAALVRSLDGHTDAVTACAFSPDGREVLSASDDRTLRLWDRTLVRSFAGHSKGVEACAFAPDGREVLSASEDGTLKLWDRATGTLVRSFEGHSSGVRACAFSPDGGAIVSASADRTLGLWDRKAGARVRSFEGHVAEVTSCAFSPDGREVLSASADRTLRLWDRKTGALVRSYEGHVAEVASCAFSPDGREVLSASRDGTLRLWDRTAGTLVRSLRGHAGEVLACAFSPDGREVLSASADGTLRLWDRATGALLRSFERHSDWVWACAFSPDGREVLSASADGTLKLWDRATGALVRSFEEGPHPPWLRGCAFSPDGRELLSATSLGALRLRDAPPAIATVLPGFEEADDPGELARRASRNLARFRRPTFTLDDLPPLLVAVASLPVAAGEGRVDLVELLLDHGAAVDSPDARGRTALPLAARKGHLEVAELLLAKGASLDSPAGGSWSALHHAAWWRRLEVVDLLVARGAVVDPFIAAALGIEGPLDAIEDVTKPRLKGRTILHWAVRSGRVDVVERLLDRGLAVDAADEDGQQPLHRASTAAVAELLIRRGAAVDARTRANQTPLHFAAHEGYADVVRALLAHGASRDVQDDGNMAPREYAEEAGHHEIAKLLRN